MLCLSIAFIFWLTTKLSASYRTHLSIPIRYELPQLQIFRNPPPKFCEVDIQATGWELTQIQQTELFIPAAELYPHTIFSTQEIQQRLQKNISKAVQIHNILPRQIELFLEPLISKEIPLVADLNISPAAMYRLTNAPRLKPDFVTVSGPQSVVDTIKVWHSQQLNLQDINQAVRQTLALRSHTNSQVTVDIDAAFISIDVQQITEKQITVPITIADNNDSLLIVLLPQTATLTFVVGLKDYSKVQVSDFELFVTDIDTDVTTATHEQLLPLHLGKKSTLVDIIRIEPSEVRYLIKKINR
jgi:hypothetical protein